MGLIAVMSQHHLDITIRNIKAKCHLAISRKIFLKRRTIRSGDNSSMMYAVYLFTLPPLSLLVLLPFFIKTTMYRSCCDIHLMNKQIINHTRKKNSRTLIEYILATRLQY